MTRCPLCKSSLTYKIWEEHAISGLKCQSCSVIFIRPDSEFRAVKVYSEDYFRYHYLAFEPTRLAYFQKLADIFSDFFTMPDTLLDVGCGVGYFLEVMQSRGWRVLGVELADFARKYAKTKFKLDVFEGIEKVGPHRFQVITFLDVLAHADDPYSLFRDATEKLAPTGYIVIKTPSRPTSLFKAASIVSPLVATRGLLHIPAQLFHFNAITLRWLLNEVGVKMVEARRIKELSLPVPWRRHAKAATYNRLLKLLGIIGVGTSLLVIGRKS